MRSTPLEPLDPVGLTTPAGATARARCERCDRPLRACLCRHVRGADNRVPVLVLQDPQEQHAAKGSVRLLMLSLLHCTVRVGEHFAAQELDGYLHGAATGGGAAAGGARPVLLYPPDAGPGAASPEVLSPESLRAQALQGPDGLAGLRLVVLDGTWRKSRKLLLSHPALQALPRLTLPAPPPSHYRIRKAHAPHQLSTLEAVCHALAAIEQAPERYAPVLAGFEGFVQQQMAWAAQGRGARIKPVAG